MALKQQEFFLVTEAEFPHGLKCGMCHRQLLPGQPYTDTLDYMTENSTPIVLLVCVYC